MRMKYFVKWQIAVPHQSNKKFASINTYPLDAVDQSTESHINKWNELV
jgi:hypothetical protein